MAKSECAVCVTGGAGYIGSALVKKLLDRGYTVHATLRNPDDQSKVGLLESFPGADTRLKLFKADIYKPEEFEEAIKGCKFVFHVATPLTHSEGFQYSNRVDATLASVRSIASSCINSGTVKRLIYTASVVAASPLKDDGSGYKDFVDETCWTPLNVPFSYSQDYLNEYTDAKTMAEKEILTFGKDGDGGLEVVSIACGLVGGNLHLSYSSQSVVVILSVLIGNEIAYNALKFLEEVIGKVPLVHIEDVSEAHIFCMETPSLNGRFLCANSYASTAEIASYYHQNYPEVEVKKEYLEGPQRKIEWKTTKLTDKGFTYKYDMRQLLDDCIKSARKTGDLGL